VAERSERSFFLAVLGPFVLAIAALALVIVVGFSMLSSVRAYVAGESLWSKGRSAAVAALRAYAVSGAEADYRQFEEALSVPLGDRRARIELDKDEPDLAVARQGFLDGDNAPEDIDGMIRLYRWFRNVSFMRDAIVAWTDGDTRIAELQTLGRGLRERLAGPASGEDAATLRVRMDTLERRLVEAEKRFTATLGRASVMTERLLMVITLLLASVLALVSAVFVRRVLRAQVEDRRLLEEANRRWALAADAAGLGLFEWRHAEDRFMLDERAQAICRIEVGSALDRADLRARIHPDDQPLVQQAWDAAFNDGELFQQRYRLDLPGDAERWVEAIGIVRGSAAAHDQRIVGVLRDITDEAALARLTIEKQAAERVAKARVDFLSRLSHELRTPLNAVLGLAQLLRIDTGDRLTTAQDRRVAIILESGQQLLRLVEDVLDITRIDSGSVALELSPTDLRAAMQSSLNLVEPERAAFEVTIENTLPPQPARVNADPQRLQQVFVNLLSNGCKYNRRGGRLTIDGRDDGAWLHIGFTDQGQGLDAGQLGELFQPFKRLAPTAQVGGVGLGLVVVKLLVEQMRGRIDVRSTPGHGSCFTVSMPKA
jgi:signal transduction histidine kinase